MSDQASIIRITDVNGLGRPSTDPGKPTKVSGNVRVTVEYAAREFQSSVTVRIDLAGSELGQTTSATDPGSPYTTTFAPITEACKLTAVLSAGLASDGPCYLAP